MYKVQCSLLSTWSHVHVQTAVQSLQARLTFGVQCFESITIGVI